MPSMPGAPLLRLTCAKARLRFSMSRTCVIRVEISGDAVIWCSPATGSSTGVAALGSGGGVEGPSPSRLSDALPSLFTPVPSPSRFSPSVRAAPTMPSADFCPALKTGSPVFSRCRFRFSDTWQISRGKTRILPRVDAGFTKCTLVGVATNAVDRGLRGHVPAGPECITPHIRFLFIAPRFRLGLPPHLASRRRTCPLANLRLYIGLVSGLAPDWIRAMHGTHVRIQRLPKAVRWNEGLAVLSANFNSSMVYGGTRLWSIA